MQQPQIMTATQTSQVAAPQATEAVLQVKLGVAGAVRAGLLATEAVLLEI